MSFAPGASDWYVREEGGVLAKQFGLFGDIPVPADYDGDGFCEIAVFRPSTGEWYLEDGQVTQFGLGGDVPVPADYDGDERIDRAVSRPATGEWYVRLFDGSVVVEQFRLPSDKLPFAEATYRAFRQRYNSITNTSSSAVLPALVYSPSEQLLFVGSLTGSKYPVPASPGKYIIYGVFSNAIEIAERWGTFSQGVWTTYSQAEQPAPVVSQFGLPGDIPVNGDFDGDVITDLAVYRGGQWFYSSSRFQLIIL